MGGVRIINGEVGISECSEQRGDLALMHGGLRVGAGVVKVTGTSPVDGVWKL